MRRGFRIWYDSCHPTFSSTVVTVYACIELS
jgi:hypothetical protein